MIISDLNHLEVVEAEVVGGFNLGYDFSKIYFNEYFNIYKNVDSTVKVEGNLATAESDAVALGKDSLTQVFTKTYTDGYTSASTGVSISASN